MWINSTAVYAASLIIGLIGLSLIAGFAIANADAKLVVGSAMLIASGVMFTAAVKLHSEERDRAYRFLTENQNSQELLAAMKFVGQLQALNGSLTLAQAAEIYTSKQSDHKEVLKKIAAVGNFYEEMGIGIRSRQINEYIVKQFHIGMLYRMGSFVKPILPVIRNSPPLAGHPSGTLSRPEVYENLCWLYDRWAPEYECDYLKKSRNGVSASFSWTGRS